MRNFKRQLTLLIADDSGLALDLSGFHVIFEVAKTAAEKPNEAKIQIYNLASTTATLLTDKDMPRIVLQAGYEDNYGVIFDGNIVKTELARNGADTILTITAGDGDKAYSYAIVNQSLASGYTQADMVKNTVSTMQAKGVRDSDIKAINTTTKYPRGRTMFGSARQYSRQMAKANDCQWSVQDGKVVFCKTDKPADGTAFLLSSQSGLIGSPSKDKDGVTAKCCLNPQLKIYDPVQIQSFAVNGVFKILTVKHSGDTHGNGWETEIKAVSLDQSTKKTTTK